MYGYSRRWHATTITSLYSIITSGLVGSMSGAGMNNESHTRAAGAVYTHRSAEWRKALFNTCFRPAFDDGHLWGVLLELACDEGYRVGLDTKTTQRAYHLGVPTEVSVLRTLDLNAIKEKEFIHVAGPLKPDEESNPFFSKLNQPTQQVTPLPARYLKSIPTDAYILEARHNEVVVMEDKEGAGLAGAWGVDESSAAVKEAVRRASHEGLSKGSPPKAALGAV